MIQDLTPITCKLLVRRVVKRRELSRLRHPPPLEVLWQQAAEQAELSPEALRSGGRSVRVVEARDGFVRRAAFAAGWQITVLPPWRRSSAALPAMSAALYRERPCQDRDGKQIRQV